MTNRNILLVEDNPDDIELTLRALKKNRISNAIVVKRDGDAALRYLLGDGEDMHTRCAQLPAIVLLDLKLPKIDGIQVLKRLRSDPQTRLLPVIVLTSSTEDRDIIDSYSLGANSYVNKPVSFDQFVETVRQLGLYWLVLNSPPPIDNGK